MAYFVIKNSTGVIQGVCTNPSGTRMQCRDGTPATEYADKAAALAAEPELQAFLDKQNAPTTAQMIAQLPDEFLAAFAPQIAQVKSLLDMEPPRPVAAKLVLQGLGALTNPTHEAIRQQFIAALS